MGKRSLRRFWLYRGKRWLGRRGQLLLSIIFGVVAACILIRQFDAALRPQLVSIAQAQMCNQITRISDRTLAASMEEGEKSGSDMVFFSKGPTGETTALSIDTVRLNVLRTSIMEGIVSQIEALDDHSLGIPLGTLTGIDLFSAWGPVLPVRVLSVASAEGTYRNEFTGAGINQTLHRILLDVTVTARLLMPGGITETTVSIPVCIAETVIVGQVPQTYLHWGQSQRSG